MNQQCEGGDMSLNPFSIQVYFYVGGVPSVGTGVLRLVLIPFQFRSISTLADASDVAAANRVLIPFQFRSISTMMGAEGDENARHRLNPFSIQVYFYLDSIKRGYSQYSTMS